MTVAAPFHIPGRPGTHRLPCPSCNRGKRDDALAVTVEADGSAVWLCHRCGLKGSERLHPETRPTSEGGEGRRRETRRQLGDDTADRFTADTAAKIERALDVWRAGQPIEGTPGEIYLHGRGLSPDGLATSPPGWPETLRWSTDADGRGNGALVVAVNDGHHGCVRAVQRVFLQLDGSPIRDPNGGKRKRALGPLKGNAARLSCAPDPDGWWGLAEGAETALAARQITGVPTWAAISAGNMANVRPPHWARHALIFADHDANGIGLREAAKALAGVRTLAQIVSARVVMADQIGQDAADVLREAI